MAVGTAAVSIAIWYSTVSLCDLRKHGKVTQVQIKMIVKHARSKIFHPINLCEEQVLSSIYGLFSVVKVI